MGWKKGEYRSAVGSDYAKRAGKSTLKDREHGLDSTKKEKK